MRRRETKIGRWFRLNNPPRIVLVAHLDAFPSYRAKRVIRKTSKYGRTPK